MDEGGTVVDVLIVVVTFHSVDVLPGFFASLPGALEGIHSHRVVVSDNASDDGTVEVARELCPDATVVVSVTNRGYAAAINEAVEAGGSARTILILNDDIRLGVGSVRALAEALEHQERVGIAVPRLVDGEGHLLKSLRREPTPLRAFGEAVAGGDRAGWYSPFGGVVQDPAVYEQPTNPVWASGCAWLISSECWEAVGEWDESLFLYSEDVDYALRTRDAGFLMRYVPNAEVVHLVGPSHRDPRLWSMSVWNRYRVYRRRHGPFRSLMFRLGLLLNETLRSVAGRDVHKAGALALVSRSHRPPEVR